MAHRHARRLERVTPAVLIIVAAAALLAGCKTTSEQSVSADPRNPSAVAPSERELAPAARSITIRSGTHISVRLLQAVSSASAHSGEDFQAELAAPVVVDGSTAFLRSARVRGRVVAARPSGRLKNPGYLRLSLDAIQTADGKWADVHTNSVSAKGKGHGKRNATLIGGGAGLGGLIGGLVGGGKGAAIGAVSGAGAGTAGAYATGKTDVVFGAEHNLTFKTIREVVVNSTRGPTQGS
jgi:hypothetical protein